MKEFFRRITRATRQEQRAIEAQGPLRSNSFEAYVLANAREFEKYTAFARTDRVTERVWRDQFAPVFEAEVEEKWRGKGVRLRGSSFEAYRADSYREVFETMPHVEQCIDDAPDQWSDNIDFSPEGRLHAYSAAYNKVSRPLRAKVNDQFRVIYESLGLRMTTDYRMIADMHDYFVSLQDGSQKELIAAYFRDFANIERKQKDAKKPGNLDPIREHWQQIARQEEYSPVIFERFWESVRGTRDFEKTIALLRLGALAALNSRDESVVLEPTDRQIMIAVSRFPRDLWPEKLKEEYVKFGVSDPAVLINGIRNRLLEIFPREQNGTHFKPAKTEDLSSKRKAGQGVVISKAETQIVIQPEKVEKPLEVAVLTRDSRPQSQNTHQVAFVEADRVEETIEGLAQVGVTPEMRTDLANILRRLRDPKIANALFVSKLHIHLSIGGAKLQLRRLRPGDIADLSFQDPDTAGARITFALSRGIIYIDGVFSNHKDYERRIS